MSNFKDCLESDMNVFYNSDEMGEDHVINGQTITVIPLDGEELKKHVKYLGLASDSIAYSVPATVYGKAPRFEEYQDYDGKPMLVTDIKINAGEYLITLSGSE